MAMSTGAVASAIASYFELNLDTTRDWETYDLGKVITSVFDKEFQGATRSNPNFLIAPPAGTLNLNECLTTYTDSATARNFAICIGNKIANYWAKATGIGQACYDDYVDSVVNDAQKIASPIAKELLSLSYNNLQVPYWLDFANIIIGNVKTISWNVTECRSTKDGIIHNDYTEFVM